MMSFPLMGERKTKPLNCPGTHRECHYSAHPGDTPAFLDGAMYISAFCLQKA